MTVILERSYEDAPVPEAGAVGLALPELEAQYAAYRRRQARGLIRLLPREAVRPLYRRALTQGFGEGDGSDPLGTLLLYCERLLPLPPFETWLEDVRLHATAHLADLEDSAEAPTADAPATVEARGLHFQGQTWIARLRSYRDRHAWRGYIAFESCETKQVHHTAVIFREAAPVDVRERFLTFDPAALRAFLRSALP